MLTSRSIRLMEPFYMTWKIGGATKDKDGSRKAYIVYSVILQICVTCYYPCHLLLALFSSENPSDNVKNLSISITCTSSSLKFLIFAWQIKKLIIIESLIVKLDERIKGIQEEILFGKIRNLVRAFTLIFLGAYGAVGASAVLSFIFKPERGLLYPAWFPFNWLENTSYYVLANLYQIIGISFLIIQNTANDYMPSVLLCILSGHTKLLASRVSKIGYLNDDLLENEKELLSCIHDQENLYSLFDVIQEFISFPAFIQVTVSAANICLAIAALIFYADSPMEIIYYGIYSLGVLFETFPTCYFGSDIEKKFGELPYAVFSSNWIPQSRTYKKHMLLFAERSLKKTTALAGGMLRIHLDTFFSTCRGAYSLFAVILRLK